jgi:hypothetical protein
MSYVLNRRARLVSRLKQVRARIAALDDLYIEAATNNVESYAFDSGEGSQRTTRRSIEKIRAEIEALEATEDHIINELYGMGIVSVKLRRKSPRGADV